MLKCRQKSSKALGVAVVCEVMFTAVATQTERLQILYEITTTLKQRQHMIKRYLRLRNRKR